MIQQGYSLSSPIASRQRQQLDGEETTPKGQTRIMGTDPKLAEVIAYLKAEFPGFDIACLNDGEYETVLQLKSSDQLHNIRVQRDFLECTSAEDIPVKLTEFRLAPTLRDLAHLPIAVTVNGCIFT